MTTEAPCAEPGCGQQRGLKSDAWHHPPPGGLEPTCPRCYDHAYRPQPQPAADAVEEAWASYNYAYGAVFAFEDHDEWRAALDAERAKVEQAVREAAGKDAEARIAGLVEAARAHVAAVLAQSIDKDESQKQRHEDESLATFEALTAALRGEPVGKERAE